MSSDHFKQELRAQLDQANKRGAKHILINSHELQVAVGGFPRADSVPSCCDVMENEMKSGDILLVAMTSETGMTVQYFLPRSLG